MKNLSTRTTTEKIGQNSTSNPQRVKINIGVIKKAISSSGCPPNT